MGRIYVLRDLKDRNGVLTKPGGGASSLGTVCRIRYTRITPKAARFDFRFPKRSSLDKLICVTTKYYFVPRPYGFECFISLSLSFVRCSYLRIQLRCLVWWKKLLLHQKSIQIVIHVHAPIAILQNVFNVHWYVLLYSPITSILYISIQKDTVVNQSWNATPFWIIQKQIVSLENITMF